MRGRPQARFGRRLSLAACCVAGVAMGAPAAAGAAEYSTSVSPESFSYPGPDLVYRLHIKTGAQAERVMMGVGGDATPTFPTLLDGQFLRLLDARLEGPGTVTDSGYVIGFFDSVCPPPLPHFHGARDFRNTFMEVEIPANSESAFAISTRPLVGLGKAPWQGMDLSMGFTVSSNGGPAQTVRSPSPVNTGSHGVQISMQTHPEGKPNDCGSLPTFASGTEVVFSGTTTSDIAGQLMTIRYAHNPDEGQASSPDHVEDLAQVPVGEDGTFSYRWRPILPGVYTFGALYRSQDARFTDDFSDPTMLRIAPPPSPGASPPSPLPPTAFRPRYLRSRVHARCLRGACDTRTSPGGRPGGGSTYRVTVRGRYRQRPCGGALRLTFRVKGTRPLIRFVKVRPDCRFRQANKLRVSSRTELGATLRVRQSFLGNATVEGGKARTIRTRLGRT